MIFICTNCVELVGLLFNPARKNCFLSLNEIGSLGNDGIPAGAGMTVRDENK